MTDDLNLFKALESIGAYMEDMWQGEWTGPIMFKDAKNAHALFLVTENDHGVFALWLKENPEPTEEQIKAFAREALVRLSNNADELRKELEDL